MLLVKCSRQARALVERAGRQFLRTTIRDAREGERVIFALNKADLAEGEKQIALQGRLRAVRALAEGEAATLGAPAGTSWKFVAEFDAVAPIEPAFDLADVLGDEQAAGYRRVTVARTIEAEDAAALEDRLGDAPSESTPAASKPSASKPSASKPSASKPSRAKASPAKTPSAKPPSASSAPAASVTSRPEAASDQPARSATAGEEAPFEMAWILRDLSLSRIRFAVYLLIAFFLGAAIF